MHVGNDQQLPLTIGEIHGSVKNSQAKFFARVRTSSQPDRGSSPS